MQEKLKMQVKALYYLADLAEGDLNALIHPKKLAVSICHRPPDEDDELAIHAAVEILRGKELLHVHWVRLVSEPEISESSRSPGAYVSSYYKPDPSPLFSITQKGATAIQKMLDQIHESWEGLPSLVQAGVVCPSEFQATDF